MQPDYYQDQRFCPRCDAYVNYLLSPQHAYCARCAAPVRLFSAADRSAFDSAVKASKGSLSITLAEYTTERESA